MAMTTSRELLDLAADYARAQEDAVWADVYGGTPAHDADAIAARMEQLTR